jgi:cytochrome c1
MLKQIVTALALAAVAVLGAGPALAAGNAKKPKHQEWSWDGPFGTYDRAAVQRGFQVYKQVCSACHGMKMLSYRNLGETGGPFQAVAPKKWQEKGVDPVLGLPGHGKYTVAPTDNPYVKALAANYTTKEINPETGDIDERPARPADKFVYPYENEGQGRAANGGAYPPDLSVITKARHYGADYIYAFLTGYGQPIPPGIDEIEGKHWNPYYKGGWVSMADQVGVAAEAEAISYADGQPKATKEQIAKDVVTFLQWAADPHMEARKSMGVQVLAYLFILSLLLYLAYRQVWRNTKH